MKKSSNYLLGLTLLVLSTYDVRAQNTNFGITPTGSTQTISATTSNNSVTLNSSPGDTVIVQNIGPSTAFIRCGPTAAAVTDFPLQSGWAIALNCPPNNKVNAITSSSTASIYVTKGLGATAMTGGGGGGGSGTLVIGNVSNATSAVATSSTNVPTVSYNYGFNGTTWDQLQVDASKFLKVTVASSSSPDLAPVAPATATATKSDLIGCQYNSTNLAFTNGQQGQVGCDQRGGLYVQDGQAIPSVSLSALGTLFTVSDTSGYSSISVQVTSAGTACTITYEVSEDGATWFSVAGYTPLNTGTTTAVSTSTTAIELLFPTVAKQFRARVSTYGSATVTVQGTMRKDPIPKHAIFIGNASLTVSGSINDATNVGANGLPTLFEGRTTNKTAVTTGQYVRPIATSIGAAVNKPYQVPELDWAYVAASGGISNTTTAVTMVAAAGAGIRNYITSCQLSSDALGAATELAFRDGAAGTVIWRTKLGTAGLVDGENVTFTSPIKSSAATLLEVVTLTASITGGVFVNCQGYQAP